jgi:hypothetical protein
MSDINTLTNLMAARNIFNSNGEYERIKSLYEAMKKMVGNPSSTASHVRDCANALEKELYALPFRNMDKDGAEFEIVLGKADSKAVDSFFKSLVSVGAFRHKPLPCSDRKVLSGMEYFTALFECYKKMYMGSEAYKKLGINELTDVEKMLTFDPQWYKEQNSDLSNFSDVDASRHFWTFGIYEYRDSSPVFDPLYYGRKNNITNSSINIYRDFGTINNPKSASASFNLDVYKKMHPELTEVLSNNSKDWLYAHYYKRQPSQTSTSIFSSTYTDFNNLATKIKSNLNSEIAKYLSVEQRISSGGGWSTQWSTTGGTPIQGIMLRLTGPLSAVYEIIYRVSFNTLGWLGWASNGQKAGAGTTGKGVGCNAIEIKIVKKAEANDNTLPAYLDLNLLNHTSEMQKLNNSSYVLLRNSHVQGFNKTCGISSSSGSLSSSIYSNSALITVKRNEYNKSDPKHNFNIKHLNDWTYSIQSAANKRYLTLGDKIPNTYNEKAKKEQEEKFGYCEEYEAKLEDWNGSDKQKWLIIGARGLGGHKLYALLVSKQGINCLNFGSEALAYPKQDFKVLTVYSKDRPFVVHSYIETDNQKYAFDLN